MLAGASNLEPGELSGLSTVSWGYYTAWGHYVVLALFHVQGNGWFRPSSAGGAFQGTLMRSTLLAAFVFCALTAPAFTDDLMPEIRCESDLKKLITRIGAVMP